MEYDRTCFTRARRTGSRDQAASFWHGIVERYYWIMVYSGSAGKRRHLPSSPFKPPPEAPAAEVYEVDDLVTHDKYGLGRVILVEDDNAVVVDFTPRKVRITRPFARMTKL
jgi:hypothetical protein